MTEDIVQTINANSLIFGDCMELLHFIPSASIPLILSDLPYGTTNCKWDSILPLNQLWLHYKRIIKSNGAIVLTAQTPFDKILGASNIPMLKYEWIWEKTKPTGFLNAKKAPMKTHENILVFYAQRPTYNPQKTYGHNRKVASAKNRAACIERQNNDNGNNYLYNKQNPNIVPGYDSTERYPRSVVKFKTDTQTSSLHPTQKPVALFEYLIKTYTNEGDVVLDNCAGSGTTAIACINTNRKYICMEKDERYFEIMKNRVASHITP